MESISIYSMEGLKEGLQIRNDKEVCDIIEISKNPAVKIKEYRDTWLKSVTGKESGIDLSSLTESQKMSYGNYNVALSVRAVLDRGAWKSNEEKARIFIDSHKLYDYVCKELKVNAYQSEKQ